MRAPVLLLVLVVAAGCSASATQAARLHSPAPSAFSPTPVVGVSPEPDVSPAPSPSPVVDLSPTPLPTGQPVARQVLAPATVMPIPTLCSTAVEVYQNGNVGPLFCRDGSINIEAWRKLADVDSNLLRLGRTPTVDDVKSAIRADFSHTDHTTNVIEYSGYQLATAYYGWNLPFDYWSFVMGA